MIWYLFNQLYSGKNYVQLFQKCECSQVGPSPANIYKKGGGGSKKGQFYENLITEWPLMATYHQKE